MSLSIIIAHYAPKVNCEKYFKLLKDNIDIIRGMHFSKDIEIIVCDDGSYWSFDLFDADSDEIIVLNKEKITENAIFADLNIDKYYGLKDIDQYRGVILKDKAIRNSKYEKIIILDDDHHFINKNSLTLFSKYLDKYIYVKGRVIGPDNIPQLFLSKNAQGTTYGFRKELYINCGGFSAYLFENGFGEDNDILYQFYNYLSKNYSNKVSCFAADISTKDLASNRWADRAAGNIQFQNQINLQDQNARFNTFVNDFINVHKIHPFKNNLSRIRYRWIVLPSINSFLYELFYIAIYVLMAPKNLSKLLKRIKQKGGLNFVYHRLFLRMFNNH